MIYHHFNLTVVYTTIILNLLCLIKLAYSANNVPLVLLESGNFASGSINKEIIVWDVINGKLKNFFDHGQRVSSLTYFGNGLLASGSYMNIKIWDLKNGKLKFTFDQSNGGEPLASLENGYLASGSRDETVKIWDVTNGKLKFTFDKSNGGHSGLGSNWVNSLLSLSNGLLASGAIDSTVKRY